MGFHKRSKSQLQDLWSKLGTNDFSLNVPASHYLSYIGKDTYLLLWFSQLLISIIYTVENTVSEIWGTDDESDLRNTVIRGEGLK